MIQRFLLLMITQASSSSIDTTPERELQARLSVLTSPSEAVQTIVTYNASFETSLERMDFALKVCHMSLLGLFVYVCNELIALRFVRALVDAQCVMAITSNGTS